MKVNAREARRRFSELLDRAERGEEIVIERRGHRPVRLVSGAREPKCGFPDLAAFRDSIQIDGALSEAVLEDRENARY